VPFFHKNIRLDADNYIGQRWYFVTLCCKDKKCIFAVPENARWLVEILHQQAILNQFSVYAYCIMPDHIHMLVCGLTASSNLLAFVKAIKQRTSYAFRRRHAADLWQKKFYDHILRKDDAVTAVAAYIWMNPVRKGICGDPREYEFVGSFVLDWKHAPRSRKGWTPPWTNAPT
jgi:putative transposase